MLHRLLHPPSENEDDPEVMLGLPSARTERGSYRYRWWHALVLLVIVFPYISIFVLFGLVSNESETNNVSNLIICCALLALHRPVD